MLHDFEIAKSARLEPIQAIAEKIGLLDDELIPYGRYKTKVRLSAIERLRTRPLGKYVVVTAITPTPLGEGKTVNTIGLSLGLHRIGHRVATCLRQPSMGPIFGIKGGAAGGGYSQVVPMEDFNLHLTGDFHAVGVAHNLLAAFLDNSLFRGNPLGIDVDSISLRRVVDINDRALRKIRVGLGDDKEIARDSGFDITAASEVMAILGLARSLPDMRRRLGRIVVGWSRDGRSVTAEALKGAGAMAVVLREAIFPTLMQTLEQTPCFVHSGPFANIAHGNSSILADAIALRCADYVVTEAGFGADMGAEKFFNIKCRESGFRPDAAALVATVRALKMHGGGYKIVAGKPLPPELVSENRPALERGIDNLAKQIENVREHGVPVVVLVNRFPDDREGELEFVRERALALGAAGAEISEAFAKGGEGMTRAAEAIVRAATGPRPPFRFLYDLEWPAEKKIEAIATRMYGAEKIDVAPGARASIERFESAGYAHLPICMAKTQLSLSHDPALKGRPRGFTFPIREVRLAAGAGFLTPLAGEINTMPGLPSTPGGTRMDVDENGEPIGLF
ncbi:MAG: formate--tetrahydrofolate ligase [Planctomycetes bacterium]|nr:formate--tetrahydrofolate ligase [Planctomycetota bacterium]MBI3845736.1 formate--tetrahydrofolate ligase [Planctomycetota bacterium]